MLTLKNWRERMSEDMRLRDFRQRTQEAYLLAATQFIDWDGCEPEVITGEHVRSYFLYLREERKLAPSNINIAVYAIRFLCLHTLQRDWSVFELLRAQIPQRLPVVLSRGDVRQVLGVVRHPLRRMALTTIYALGLRLGEGLGLESEHIDSQRLSVWGARSQGSARSGDSISTPAARAAASVLEAGTP